MKFVAAIILFGLLLVLGTQIYSFFGRERDIRHEFSEFKEKLENAKLDQEKFRAELGYYLNPANLEKELRARFNYKSPGEKLIIIVPRNETTTDFEN